ncbi:hypothetical protein [Lentibacillus saliphilus]|uniref:hypothetical protein n=1 Tax=Lentibacillus saliphilus TaxID=2737028 RepID=UPI001FE2EBDD|nr:hypothetical protein [Lentibacillus saliphilus]
MEFIKELIPLLKQDGQIMIGDVAFKTRAQLEACRHANLKIWDDDEFYFVFEELTKALEHICQCHYHQVSHCGGIIILTPYK